MEGGERGQRTTGGKPSVCPGGSNGAVVQSAAEKVGEARHCDVGAVPS